MVSEASPAKLLLDQKAIRKCHTPHRLPTISAVAKTPYRSLNLGTANPVQPSSSKKPPPISPHAMPNRSKASLSFVFKMPGRNAGESSESVKSTAATTNGGNSSATAYQH